MLLLITYITLAVKDKRIETNRKTLSILKAPRNRRGVLMKGADKLS
jgi:hypothetical protein